METLFGIMVGIGLAASCGFRVFVPMLIMSVAVRSGHLQVAENWSWLGSWPAMIAFGVATLAEILGFYIPWLDNLLDTIASPSAVIAGTIATAACVSNMSPFLQWATAIIAGGGIAGVVQGATVISRAASTTTTGGLGNFIIASLELIASFALSMMAVIVPILSLLLVSFVGFWVARVFDRWRTQKSVPLAA